MSLPEGTTHVDTMYGTTYYYRRREVDHLNQVSEEWQKRVEWDVWGGNGWEPVGEGFSPRRLKRISNELT